MTIQRREAKNALRRGACPGVLTPMETGDGLLVRLRLTAGSVKSDDARAIADAATTYGNGLLDLSARANLQLRGVRMSTLEPLTHDFMDRGLVDANPDGERVRNLTVDPLSADGLRLAHAIEQRLISDPALAALPPKFGFLLDAGGPCSLDGWAGDVSFRRQLDNSYSVGLGGTDCASEIKVGAICDDRLPSTAVEIAKWMLAEATRIGQPLRRARQFLTQNPAALDRLPIEIRQPAGSSYQSAQGHKIGLATETEHWVGFGLPFGRLDANTLAALSLYADEFGDGLLRLTPWRAILVAVPAQDRVSPNAAATRLAGSHGLILNRNDPLRIFAACPGSAGCNNGKIDAQNFARKIAASIDTTLQSAAHIHISGCLKGCAHPKPAAITLVADDTGLAIIAKGDTTDEPVAYGLSQAKALAMVCEMTAPLAMTEAEPA